MKRLSPLSPVAAALLIAGCASPPSGVEVPPGYLDSAGRADAWSGGARRIPVHTEKGSFEVWVRRFGNNPRVKLLILHGGPGMTHEYLEAVDTFLPAAGVEYYHYDQLGSFYSDQPDEPELWEIPRFVDEVEQVRRALDLDADDFYLYGHSWGAILGIEYALKYPDHLKALILSNMMSSIPAYNEYAETVLIPQADPDAIAEIKRLEAAGDIDDPRYMELLVEHHYTKHILRRPADEWPDGLNRTIQHINQKVYVPMQGPSELGAKGKILHWDRSADLGRITVPTLVIGARYDTMDPEHLRWMADALPRGRFHYCPDGSHLAIYDDQQTYFDGLLDFLRDVDRGTFDD